MKRRAFFDACLGALAAVPLLPTFPRATVRRGAVLVGRLREDFETRPREPPAARFVEPRRFRLDDFPVFLLAMAAPVASGVARFAPKIRQPTIFRFRFTSSSRRDMADRRNGRPRGSSRISLPADPTGAFDSFESRYCQAARLR